MNNREIQETPVWQLFEKGQNYHRMTGIYTDTDLNYRMFNGDQWAGAKLGDIAPVQINFIKPIVKYKVAVIHDNLYAIVYQSMNYENRAFRETAEKICEMLNRYASRVWEQNKMDFKGRRVTRDSAINDEGIMHTFWDEEKHKPVTEVLKKADVYYGNENDDDIQSQPYILIRKRLPEAAAIELALREGMPESKKTFIRGDNETFEESGDAAKREVDDMVTIVYKYYREKGVVHYDVSTRWVTIASNKKTGLTLYPVAHLIWEEKEGSARGEGEVRNLIPNQIEVNKTEMRRVLTVKSQAYPQKVVDESKVSNPDEVKTIGGVIKTKGQTVDDVRKVVGTLPPAQMSPDVKILRDDLIQFSRELAGAGETATGQVNPETASGRAILAVQQASQAPMTEQKESYKNFVEDIAKIWLEFIIVYSPNGIKLERTVTDSSGQEIVVIENIPQESLRQLQADVKIEITPKSVYDRFAQEQTMENFLLSGLLSAQRVSELRIYAELLPDDSVAPKQKILDACKKIEQNQIRIAQIEANAQRMLLQANGFVNADPRMQAEQIAQSQNKAFLMQLLQAERAKKQPEKAEIAENSLEEIE